MTIKIINVGSASLSGDGEPIRDAFIKVNENFNEISNRIDDIEIPDLSDFITADDLPPPVDLSEYALVTDIPDVSNFITADDLPPPVDLSEYALVTDIPDVSNFITADDLPPPVDLSEYALVTDIPDVSNFITADDVPFIPEDISDLTDTQGLLGQGGSLDLSGVLLGNPYKGFGARYGRMYESSQSFEQPRSKIVIFKDTAVNTKSSIAPNNSTSDFFEVNGLENSDVVAMFIVHSNASSDISTRRAKSLEDLESFAKVIIDEIILANGVEGSVNTIQNMREAFYSTNTSILVEAAGGDIEIPYTFYFYVPYELSDRVVQGGSGSGLEVNRIYIDEETGELIPQIINLGGQNYQVGDIFTILGTNIGMSSPENDVTLTVTQVDPAFNNRVTALSAVGNLPFKWPTTSIIDYPLNGTSYDNGNFINTDLSQEISYNNGEILSNANTAFGDGSSYCVLYSRGIFGIIATNSSANTIGTSGETYSVDSTLDTGLLMSPGKPYDITLPYLVLTNRTLGPAVNFVKQDYGDEIDILVPDDGQGGGVGITRGENQGIYNPFRESGWDSDISPDGTLWNMDGWDDLSDVTTRSYIKFFEAYDNILGPSVIGKRAILYIPSVEKYYALTFTSWTQGGQGGGFSYTRYEINASQLEEGIRFNDNTVLKSAQGLGRIKSTAPRERRIEEVTGYKEVSVTNIITVNLTAVTSRSATNQSIIWLDSALYPAISAAIDDPTAAGINDNSTIQFSIDNVNWYSWDGGTSFSGTERGYFILEPLTYNTSDTIYFRYDIGGAPQVWWNKADLPGGSSNFRGAVIDYHAYTGEATWIGTVHIVDDDGDENIAHTEVSSGSTDSENDDLWVVDNEGTIKYRRIDGEAKTLKIHWTAKVFYGSETFD